MKLFCKISLIIFISSCTIQSGNLDRQHDNKEIVLENISEIKLVYDIFQYKRPRVICWPIEKFEDKQSSVLKQSIQDVQEIRFLVKKRPRNTTAIDIKSTLKIKYKNLNTEKIVLNRNQSVIFYNGEFYNLVKIKPHNLFKQVNREANKRVKIYIKEQKNIEKTYELLE